LFVYKIAFGRKNNLRLWRRRRSCPNHDRFVRVTAYVKHDFHYVGHDWKNHCQRLPQGSPQRAS